MLKLITALAKTSKMSKVHPVEKLFICFVPIIIMGFVKNPLIVLLNIVLILILHFWSENNMRVVLKFTIEITLFAAISLIFTIFDYGMNYCIVILLKSINAGLCLSYFSLTTPIDDVLYSLSKIDCIKDICDIAKSMERFIILVDDERIIIYNSIKSRGGFNGFPQKISSTGKMAGLLFVNTMKRWENIKEGLESRGYNGYMPYMTKEFSLSVGRIFLILSYNIIIVSLAIIYK